MGDYGKKTVSFEGAIELQQAISYLEGIVAALRAGIVTIEMDGDAVSLRPARTISLSIEAKRKKERERLSLDLSWSREREVVAPALKIHDQEVSPFPNYDEDYGDTPVDPDNTDSGEVDDGTDDDRREKKEKKRKK